MLAPTPYLVTELDVSDLEPPEPLLAIFSALIQLPDKHRLEVSHRRQPLPLYAMLDQTGYLYNCQPRQSGYLIQIWPGDSANPQALSSLVYQAPGCT